MEAIVYQEGVLNIADYDYALRPSDALKTTKITKKKMARFASCTFVVFVVK